MRRLFWLGIGAAVGVLVVRKLTKTAQAFTPQGMSRSFGSSLGHLGDAFSAFADEVRAGMAEREAELLAALSDEGTGGVPGATEGHETSR